MTATAHLPGLDIEITHRRSPEGDAEQISINLQAVPSFEAFGRYIEAANPFLFWAQAARLAWVALARGRADPDSAKPHSAAAIRRSGSCLALRGRCTVIWVPHRLAAGRGCGLNRGPLDRPRVAR
jgi:hypothetical protein